MLWVESYDKPFTLCFSPGLSSVVDLFPFLILSLFYHPLLLFPHPFQFLCLGFIKNLFVFCIYSALSNLLCETPPLSGSKMKSWAHSAFCWDINQMESLVFSEMVKDSFQPRGFVYFLYPFSVFLGCCSSLEPSVGTTSLSLSASLPVERAPHCAWGGSKHRVRPVVFSLCVCLCVYALKWGIGGRDDRTMGKEINCKKGQKD